MCERGVFGMSYHKLVYKWTNVGILLFFLVNIYNDSIDYMCQ